MTNRADELVAAVADHGNCALCDQLEADALFFGMVDALRRLLAVVPAAAHHAGDGIASEDYVVPYTRAEWDELVAATKQAESALRAIASGAHVVVPAPPALAVGDEQRAPDSVSRVRGGQEAGSL